MNVTVTLSYKNFLDFFQDYCDYDLTEDEWWTIYDFCSEISVKNPMSAGDIKDCLEYYVDDLAFLFGEFETWDDYMESGRKNDDISH